LHPQMHLGWRQDPHSGALLIAHHNQEVKGNRDVSPPTSGVLDLDVSAVVLAQVWVCPALSTRPPVLLFH
jgi:hypothetical protein